MLEINLYQLNISCQISGFVNFRDPIPLYISGFGPKSLALAGKYGDGAVLGVNTPETVSGMWHLIQKGAKEVNRDSQTQRELLHDCL